MKALVSAAALLLVPLHAADLLDAVRTDDLAAARRLIDGGAVASRANSYGATPLGLACRNGSEEMARLLLEAGAKPDPSAGEPLLVIAARTGDAACVRLLLEKGADPDAAGGGKQPPLMWAAAEGHADAVSQLLTAGADPRTRLDSGFDALFFAVRAGHREVVRQLLASGLDVNDARTPARPGGKSMLPGTAALMLAVENGHFELGLDLVAAGADPNDQRSGFTPLHAVTWVRKAARGDGPDGTPTPRGSGSVVSLDFVRRLIDAGADVNARLERGRGQANIMNPKGATPFLFACQTADLPLMKLLLERGADPKLANDDHCSPLLAACGMGVQAPGEEPASEGDSIAAAKLLLGLGADIHHADRHGETVMHCAAYKGAPELIRFLDANGADISRWNRKNKHGWTPLLIAQGFRPGNFRPFQYVVDAMSEVMRKHGIEPPPSPPPP
jgi:ankyrin repeat protein